MQHLRASSSRADRGVAAERVKRHFPGYKGPLFLLMTCASAPELMPGLIIRDREVKKASVVARYQ